jgi:hypothetical protein
MGGSEHFRHSNIVRAMVNSSGGAKLLHPAGIEYGRVSAQHQRFQSFGSRVDDGGIALPEQFAHFSAQFFASFVVKVHQRLVEE